MIAHIDEIPYFGEHTQVTVMCHDCGWKQTDFIPAEGKKAGCWKLAISNEKQLRSRVVRSSSCTVRIPELDLQVNPGSSSTGYVSNVEGVLNRFLEVMNTVLRGLQSDIEQQLVEGNKVDLTQTSKEIIQLEHLIDNVKNDSFFESAGKAPETKFMTFLLENNFLDHLLGHLSNEGVTVWITFQTKV